MGTTNDEWRMTNEECSEFVIRNSKFVIFQAAGAVSTHFPARPSFLPSAGGPEGRLIPGVVSPAAPGFSRADRRANYALYGFSEEAIAIAEGRGLYPPPTPLRLRFLPPIARRFQHEEGAADAVQHARGQPRVDLLDGHGGGDDGG